MELVTLDERDDLVLVQDRSDPASAGPFYMIDGDRAPVEVPLPMKEPNTDELAVMRFWGERLVLVDGPEPWVSADRGV
ncbi:MAG: hypothetical protein IT385_10705 [Deltaproteobacteria bacterium]|nr:hypothetical protein [Deltaproteobacteria bacterium]